MKKILLIAFPTAVVLFASLFASQKPDTLESLAISYNFADRAKEINSLFSGYAFPAVSGDFLSTFLAGIAGIVIILAVYKFIALVFK
jgi:hypothetical protein